MNRGKDFENVIKECFLKVSDVSIDRLHDQTTGFKGSKNICDFIVYKKPYEYYIECKTIRGASFPLSNVTDTQWNGLLEKSKIDGVFAGIICWWYERDITKFMPIQVLQKIKDTGVKSVNCYKDNDDMIEIKGGRKRVFFDYDMEEFFDECMFI